MREYTNGLCIMNNYSKEAQLNKNTSETDKPIKYRKCRYCKEKTVPYGSINPFCFENKCIRKHNEVVQAAKKRKAKQDHNHNDKPKLKKDVQKIANRIGKLHNLIRGEHKCVTCDSMKAKDGGHCYPTSTYSPVRYFTLQIRPQCVKCNQFSGGMPVEYREYLIKDLGLEKVLWLESFKGQVTKKHTLLYLQKYKRVMSKRLKSLEKRYARM